MTAMFEMMPASALLAFQIAVLSLFPLYFTMLPPPMRQVHFYIYIALILLLGGFMGNVYSLEIGEGVVISAGNICYGAFMMASVMFVWMERDAFILRHLVRLVILVDIFNVVFSYLTQTILKTGNIINPHGVRPELFAVSTPLIALGGVLIIAELLLLLVIFETAKKQIRSIFRTAVVYTMSFVIVLVLDGVAFSFIAFGINAEIVAIVFGGIDGKIIMASAFSIPLALFMLWQRRAFVDYLQSDTLRWSLLTVRSADLIKEMAEKDQDVRRGDIVFRNAIEGLAIVDGSGLLLKANAAFRKMLGNGENITNPENLKDTFWHLNKPVRLPQDPQDGWRKEVIFGPGKKRAGILSITPAGEDSKSGETYVYSLADITEQKDAHEKLEHLALHDQLTDLPNRRFLDQRLSQMQGKSYTLVVIDLDHFKDIIDSYGHTAGDRVVQIVGERLDAMRKERLGAGDILCHIGADSFALIVNSKDSRFIESTLESVQLAIGRTMRIDGNLEVFTSATIGVSREEGQAQRDALLEANAALFDAKRKRRGSIGFYEDGLTAESQKKMNMGLRLKNALARHEVDVHYQPQFDAVTHGLRGVEALARWIDMELGMVSPGEFIPVAEETGLIDSIGEYVLERACRDGHEWLQAGLSPVRVSVNVSASQLRFGRFIPVLRETLAKTGFPASHLEIEITESSYIEREEEVTPLLHELKEMGVSIAIDDFGTGYSSLSYLRDIPCDYVKIDSSFITDIPRNAKQCTLTQAIIKLAENMSFKVIAEGVETKEQLDFLTAQGCDVIQGYYFAPALPKAEFEAMAAHADSQQH